MRIEESGVSRWSRLDARLLLGLLAYACAVAFLQMGASPTAELDQAEQLILSQRLQWGYTNQPPLYTWLLWGIAQWTGPSDSSARLCTSSQNIEKLGINYEKHSCIHGW